MISLRDVVTGFGNRDPLAEVWRRSLRGGGGGSAVITGVPPLRYIGDGRPLTDYLISGNTVQDGTPTPESPVEVQGCGVRTANLFDKEKTEAGKWLTENGSEAATSTLYHLSEYIKISPNTEYTFGARGTSRTKFYNENKEAISETGWDLPVSGTYTAVSPSNAFFVRVTVTTPLLDTFQINLGSTALPYEPYGFKLPLTVNGVEYPIYLGTVPTTRRVKKQNVTISYMVKLANGNAGAVTEGFPSIAVASILHKCNIAPYGTSTIGSFYVNPRNAVFVCAPGTTLSEARTLLSGAVIWYILAEPETGIVNEPLMKIGNYADTISAAQAGVAIPTVSGANVLDVPTEVPPSEIAIKGGIRSV